MTVVILYNKTETYSITWEDDRKDVNPIFETVEKYLEDGHNIEDVNIVYISKNE